MSDSTEFTEGPSIPETTSVAEKRPCLIMF